MFSTLFFSLIINANFYILFRKLWIRLSGFIREAIPLVLLGVLVTNVLYSLGVFNFFEVLLSPIVKHVWGLPPKVTVALLVGFLRKDVAVGMLAPLGLTVKQLIIGCSVLVVYFPCMGTFSVLVKELGIKDSIKSLTLMLITAVIVGGVLNLILK